MRIKLDENMPTDLAELLRQMGHDAHTCHDENLCGEEVGSIARAAISESRILITFDLDFSDVRRFEPGKHPGIILQRLYDNQKIPSCISAVRRALAEVPEPIIAGGITIVEPARIRTRLRRDG